MRTKFTLKPRSRKATRMHPRSRHNRLVDRPIELPHRSTRLRYSSVGFAISERANTYRTPKLTFANFANACKLK